MRKTIILKFIWIYYLKFTKFKMKTIYSIAHEIIGKQRKKNTK